MWSASSMMRVFTLGMSTPVSMMVVHTRTEISPAYIRDMTSLICSSVMRPWATATGTSGKLCWSFSAVWSMVSMRLWR